MPLPLTVLLLAAAVAALVVRLLARSTTRRLPLAGLARPLGPVDAVLTGVGVLGLVGHCGAMFYRPLLSAIPGTGGYIARVNAMGAASIALYVVPAVLVLVGVRRLVPAVVVLLGAALLAVGITMYDGGPLDVHLTAITVTVLLLALTTALLVSGRTAPAR